MLECYFYFITLAKCLLRLPLRTLLTALVNKSSIFTLIVIYFHYLSSTVNYDMSTAKELLLLTNSQEEQQRWVSHLLKRIPRKHPTMSPPPAAQNTPPEAASRSSPRVSPRPSPRGSPRMSQHRGAIKIQSSRQQQMSGKTR